jgi:hypothetical protein
MSSALVSLPSSATSPPKKSPNLFLFHPPTNETSRDVWGHGKESIVPEGRVPGESGRPPCDRPSWNGQRPRIRTGPLNRAPTAAGSSCEEEKD